MSIAALEAGASVLGTAEKILTAPCVIELGGDGFAISGKKYTRKYSSRDRRTYDSRILIKRLEFPAFIPLAIAAALGGPGAAAQDLARRLGEDPQGVVLGALEQHPALTVPKAVAGAVPAPVVDVLSKLLGGISSALGGLKWP